MNDSNDKSVSSTHFSIDIEQLLADGKTIKIKPQGYSMYPLFVPGRDEACIERTDFSSLKRGDVIILSAPLLRNRGIFRVFFPALDLGEMRIFK